MSFLLNLFSSSDEPSQTTELSNAEARVDLLLEHAGLKYDPYSNLPPDVGAAIQTGNKMDAIRAYREATGAGLKDAKDFIEGHHGPGLALTRIQAKLDMLLDQVGLKYDPFADVSDEVLRAVRNGEKIHAVKLYRDATGSGLKEAKDFVDSLQRQIGHS